MSTQDNTEALLNWEPGLYWDESSRTLEEVTLQLADSILQERKGLWSISLEDQNILRAIHQDSHTGIYHLEDGVEREWMEELYQEMADLVSDNLRPGLYFGYLNEGGGWGVWEYEEQEICGVCGGGITEDNFTRHREVCGGFPEALEETRA